MTEEKRVYHICYMCGRLCACRMGSLVQTCFDCFMEGDCEVDKTRTTATICSACARKTVHRDSSGHDY